LAQSILLADAEDMEDIGAAMLKIRENIEELSVE
jgi:hypothetical protein